MNPTRCTTVEALNEGLQTKIRKVSRTDSFTSPPKGVVKLPPHFWVELCKLTGEKLLPLVGLELATLRS